jgi:intracellular multiplication protein IcmD
MSTSAAETTIAQLVPVLKRAKHDAAFRQLLLNTPEAMLQASGIAIPHGMKIQAVEDTANHVNLVVPSRMADITDDDLKTVSASTGTGSSVTDRLVALSNLFAKTWTDSNLRTKLLQDPGAVLAERGINVGSGVKVRAHQATDAVSYLIVPSISTNNSSAVAASSLTSADVGDIAQYITSNFSNVARLITAGSYLAGLGFAIGSVMKFKQHKDNPTQIPIGTPIALVFIAAALLFLPSILSVSGSTTASSGAVSA